MAGLVESWGSTACLHVECGSRESVERSDRGNIIRIRNKSDVGRDKLTVVEIFQQTDERRRK